MFTILSIWIVTSLLFLVATIYYKDRFFIGFLSSAIATAIFSVVLQQIFWELLIFLALSAFFHYLLVKFPGSFQLTAALPTSLHELIGHAAVVTQPIGPSKEDTGTIKLHHQTWPALSADNIPLPKGTVVTIVARKGIQLIVKEEHPAA